MQKMINQLLGRQPKSAYQAKERLQLVLIHDRTNLSPSALESLKDELIEVISRYVDINPQAVHIEMTRDGREQRLLADIPLQLDRHRRG